MCRSRAPTADEDTIVRGSRTPGVSMDLYADAEEVRSVSNASAHGPSAMQKTPSKLNPAASSPPGYQGLIGEDGVPQGAFIIPAGAVVMMPAGSQVQYVNNRQQASNASEPESERTPETTENRIAL